MGVQNFYYFSVCHVCKRPSANLKKCGSCKVVYYCSRNHQVLDWPNHRNLCKLITKTSKRCVIPPNCNTTDFNGYKYTTGLLWRYELKRELDFVEQQMWMFPKVCSICYSVEADILCEFCRSMAYCSREHQNLHMETHQKFCKSFKLCLIIYQLITRDDISLDWLKLTVDPDVQTLPETIEEVLKLIGFVNPSDFSKQHVDYVVMAEYFCPVINMIYALEKSNFVEGHTAKETKLTIHVVGADHAESKMSWVLVYEFLAHWINNLIATSIYLIGPQVTKEDVVNLSLKCERCQAKNCVGTLVRVRGLYHEHVHSIPKPDLVVAFNSGLHEYVGSKNDAWKETVPKLIWFRGVPTILTAYTESELKKDVERFNDLEVSFVVDPRRNSYSSLRPNRNWEEGSEPVYYENGYLTIICQK